MKRLIFLLGLFVCLVGYGQKIFNEGTLVVPVLTDTTNCGFFWTYDNAWSTEVNSTNVDGVDTLYVYAGGYCDSTSYSLIWIDQNLDGANDNPWALDTTTNLFIWGEAFPARYRIYRLVRGTSTAGLIHYYVETKR